MAVLKDLIVHGSSRFLNAAYYNKIKADSVAAKEGIFNKIVATTGEISSLTVEDLTTNRATVLSLLDVRGELHTNQWTNSNIATIDGSFYITPTIGVPEGTMTTTTNSVVVNGSNFPVSSLYVNNVNSDNAASTVAWTSNSKVLITGEILVNGVYMPLGTLVGVLDGDASATQIKIKSITDNRYQTAKSLAEIGTQSTALPCRNVKVSLYQTSRSSTLYPLGIFMTALGENGKTFLDIYGGGYSAATATAGGFAKPVLRIGNLAGLPTIGTQTPTGYGIYTSNGYFSGTVAAKKGVIGDGETAWTIGSGSGTGSVSYIYAPTSGPTSKTANTVGMYVGTDGINNYSSNSQYVRIYGGKIYAQGADIDGKITATSGVIGTWRIGTDTNKSLHNGSSDASPTPASGTIILSKGVTISSAVGNLPAATYTITAGTNFGVTTAGALYASSGKIGGWNIDTNKIYSGTHSTWNSTAEDGLYLGNDGIAGGSGGIWYLWKDGSAKIGAMTLSAAGVLEVPAANITGTLSAERIAVTDFTNYCQLNSNTATLYGWTLTQDSSNPNTPWYVRDTLGRDNYPSTWFDCKPGDQFKVSMTVSSTVTGATTSGGAGGTYMTINLGVQCQTATGSSNWQTLTIVTSNAAGTETAKTGYVTIPTSAEYIKFRAFIQIGGYAPFAGTLKIRNPVIKRVGADEYITYVNSTDGIKVHSSDDTTDYLQLNSTAIKFYRNNVQKMYLDDSKLQFTNGNTLLSQLDSTSQKFYDGSGNVVASFGSDGIKMYLKGTNTESVNISNTGATFTGGIVASSLTINNNATITGSIPQSNITNLTTDLSNKASTTALTTETNQRKAKYGTQSATSDDKASQAKAITCANFELVAGNELTIFFKYANTYTSGAVQLNVNSKGAKNIWVANAVTSTTNKLLWGANAYITFRYDGAQFIVIGEPRTWYGACSTAAATAAKTDTTACTGAVICKGTTLSLAMTNENTSAEPTLNVQSTGAIAIYAGNSTTRPTASNGLSWSSGYTQEFTFDGSVWRTSDSGSSARAKALSDTAATKATDYITYIASDGIWVTPSGSKPTNATTVGSATGTRINGNGMQVFKGGYLKASFGDDIYLWGGNNANASSSTYPYTWINSSGAVIAYSNTYKTSIDSTGMKVYAGDASNPVAQYGANVTIGQNTSGQYNVYISSTGGIENRLYDKILSKFDSSGIKFYDGNYTSGGANEETYITAQFTSSNAVIGKLSGSHSIIDADGQRFYASNGTTQLANIGYGDGVNSSGSISTAPYYTFGRRLYTTSVYDSTETYKIGDLCLYNDGNEELLYVCIADIATPEEWNGEHWRYYIGNCSFAEGGSPIINIGNIASGSSSHAEGRETKAIGYLSHTEGRETKAIGESSHAEGNATVASGPAAHAEGWGTIASESYSHSQNFSTRAVKKAQTAIGKYNKEDTSTTTTHGDGYGTYAFIIGNGFNTLERSNAFTVDWDGNVMGQGMAGMIQMFAGSTAPTGWLLCNGQAVSRTTYKELFAVIGTTFGTGNGSTTFNVPDFRDRFPVGAGTSYNRNSTGGAKEVTLNADQSGLRSHSHEGSSSSSFLTTTGDALTRHTVASGSGAANMVRSPGAIERKSNTASVSASNATAAHENRPPYIGIYFIICTGKTS